MESRIIQILLYKKEIFYDINTITYKRVDASMQDENLKTKNAIQSDETETLDGSILKRLTQRRDARIRKRLMSCLSSKPAKGASNIPIEDDAFEYNLNLTSDFTEDKQTVLVSLMHDYIVRGSIYDWYYQCGMTNTPDSPELDDLESDIVDIIKQSSRRKPMQPFGPAEPITAR